MDKLGKSPDYASAYILALLDTPKRSAILAIGSERRNRREYDPYSDF
jgi:hypothetical protein